MASVQIATSAATNGRALGGQVCLEKAGNRMYGLFQQGSTGTTGLLLYYSDDGMVTWSLAGGGAVSSNSSTVGALVYDSANGRLEIIYAGTNAGNEALKHRAITSNVTTGTPGSFDTEINIDSGGTSAGVEWVSCCISPTVSNPRVWLIGEKWTSSTLREVRIWWCTAGSTSTAANWSDTTNIGSLSSTNPTSAGRILYQKIGGADRVFAVFGDQSVSPSRLSCVIFDPTAATPATAISGATVHHFGALASGSLDNWESEGPQVWAASIDDYIVVGRRDRSNGNVDWYYSTDGATFTGVTDGSITSGRAGITTDGTDFHIVHSDSFGALASTDQTLSYRKLTVASNTLGGATTFSDGNGNGVTMPRNTGASTVYVLFRRGTASPWSIRTDQVSIVTDTTPPGQATGFTGVSVSGTEIDLSAKMPSDPDVAKYTIRRTTGSSFPASDRSTGTEIVAATATTAGTTVTFSDTGLTGGTTYKYRLYVADAEGNWNTGTTLTVVARTVPVFVQRYESDGTTTIDDDQTAAGASPVLEWTIAATDFASSAVAHIRARVGTDNASPPTIGTFDVFSGAGGSNWRYESPADSGTFVNWPGSGLPTDEQTARKVRLYTPPAFVGQLYVTIRIEQ